MSKIKKLKQMKINTPLGTGTVVLETNNDIRELTCKCDSKTHFKYYSETNTINCPNCKNRENDFQIIETPNEYEKNRKIRIKQAKLEAEKNIPLKLTLVCKEWECGFEFYSLNKEIPYDDWKKVSKYFTYMTPKKFEESELEPYPGSQLYGWMTRNPKGVAEILDIDQEFCS